MSPELDGLEWAHWPLSTEIPPGWALSNIESIAANIQSGFASGKHSKTDDGGVAHLRPMNVAPSGDIDLSDVRYVAESAGLHRLEAGDILFNNTNSPAWVGKTALVEREEPLAFSNHMTRVRAAHGVHPSFLARQLHFLCRQGYFEFHCRKHVNQASVSGQTLARTVPIVVPPSNEQRRIDDKVDALFAHSRKAKESLDRIPALLEKLKKSILAAAFRGDLTKDWREANPDVEPAEKLLERIRTERRRRWEEAELAKMRAKGKEPKNDKWKSLYGSPPSATTDELVSIYGFKTTTGWGSTLLESVCDPNRGIPYGIVQTGEDTPGGIPIVRCGDIRDLTIKIEELKSVAPSISNNYQRTLLQGGEVLIAIRGTVGATAVTGPEMSGMNISREVALIPPLPGIVPEFLSLLLVSPGAVRLISGHVKGVAQRGINLADLRNLKIPIPPEAEQREIAEVVSTAFAKIERIAKARNSQLSRVDHLNQAILSKAFRGELVPQDPNDEPASALLERIRAERAASAPKKRTSSRKTKPAAPAEPEPEPSPAPLLSAAPQADLPFARSFLDLAKDEQAHALASVLFGYGALAKGEAVRLAAEGLRETGLSDHQRLRTGGKLHAAIEKALERAIQLSLLDRPAQGKVRAIKPDPNNWNENDWRMLAMHCLSVNSSTSDALIHEGSRWAQLHFGFQTNRLDAKEFRSMLEVALASVPSNTITPPPRRSGARLFQLILNSGRRPAPLRIAELLNTWIDESPHDITTATAEFFHELKQLRKAGLVIVDGDSLTAQ